MNFYCWHRWGRWSDPFKSSSTDEKVCQARRCEKCGKVHVAYVRSPWNWWFSVQVLIEHLKGQQP